MHRHIPTQKSHHAQVRCQQRAIRSDIVELLLDYGSTTPCGYSCERYAFCRKSWSSVRNRLGNNLARLERFRHAYLVVASDGVIVTAGWRH